MQESGTCHLLMLPSDRTAYTWWQIPFIMNFYTYHKNRIAKENMKVSSPRFTPSVYCESLLMLAQLLLSFSWGWNLNLKCIVSSILDLCSPVTFGSIKNYRFRSFRHLLANFKKCSENVKVICLRLGSIIIVILE